MSRNPPKCCVYLRESPELGDNSATRHIIHYQNENIGFIHHLNILNEFWFISVTWGGHKNVSPTKVRKHIGGFIKIKTYNTVTVFNVFTGYLSKNRNENVLTQIKLAFKQLEQLDSVHSFTIHHQKHLLHLELHVATLFSCQSKKKLNALLE